MRIAIAGIGTDVGKTIVSAILVKALDGDYWKPIQCGNLDNSDTMRVRHLVNDPKIVCHPESYRFQKPLSPHAAARLEGIAINPAHLTPPKTDRPLIIECAGGALVPYSQELLQTDHINTWDCSWVLVSKHYLGSINHTLLTLEALKSRGCRLSGIVFNGAENKDSEEVIMRHANCIGRLPMASNIDPEFITIHAKQWKHSLIRNLQTQ